MRVPLSLLSAVVAALLLSSCSATGPAEGAGVTASGQRVLNVVASTSVYADVAEAVGGKHVSVKAIVDKTSQDPHSYEATARDMLALSKADVIIANGGGYDPFMDSMAAGLELPTGSILHAVDFLAAGGHTEAHDEAGHDEAAPDEASAPVTDHGTHDHSGPNEHVWYDVHTVGALAAEIAREYGQLMPEHAEDFTDAARGFDAQIGSLAGHLESLRPLAEGKKFAMTEPLAYYLLTDAGLTDATPAGFSAAMEAGEDVSPLLLKRLTDGLHHGEYAVLALNTQTSGAQTDKVRSIAQEAGVPVLSMTETLPEGQHYMSWMESNVHELEVALGNG
ncbi:ABC transporter substrate-binding protein [Arthrobacter sp. MYb227]|uniref:metal ABC transporter solute-binding protein, Zn/Mn family n=1 Tax=Arthrobacter sp. MYb227 TaxID=1848601 RepID=UPI000CFAA948|nr:zinc ABC transporter substrate-binding protein [Arthrobacter sp. MYb227]PQZ88564.1 ABC transporter substrate-binding protein [Arthrobacter sp. MYb227]